VRPRNCGDRFALVNLDDMPEVAPSSLVATAMAWQIVGFEDRTVRHHSQHGSGGRVSFDIGHLASICVLGFAPLSRLT